jgi:flagellar basal-body rod protein FlgF
MQSSFYVSLSGQMALDRRMDTIARNIANMNTAGYRADGVTFQTQLANAGGNKVAFVSAGADFISRRSGPLTKTDNPLDIAVQGDGWMSIRTQSGVAYTRDGRMQISETGALQTLNGYPVLDAGGAPILVDSTAGAPTIAQDGMISQNGKQVSAIGLFSIDPSATLQRTDNSAVIPNKAASPILDFTQNGIAQGFVEGSNVDPVMEMTKLIAVTRTFDDVTAQMTQSESSLTDAIKTLGSVSA